MAQEPPSSLKLFAWSPGTDTSMAMATELLMWGVYYTNAHIMRTSRAASFFIFVVIGNLILDVLLPAYYVLRVRNEPLAELGITTKRWKVSLLISVAWSAVGLRSLLPAIHQHPGAHVLPQMIFNGLILWEPFFVFGWLQLRFERAFGILPAILTAGASLALYHVGTFPIQFVGVLFVAGLLDGILFRLTRNLLTLFPLTWAVYSSIGTLSGNFLFGWDVVALYAVVLAIQIVALGWMARSQKAHGT
jgi:hypothetical protein